MRVASYLLSAFIVLAAVAGASPSLAASSIRVKVDDQPITSYDIQQRTQLLNMTGVKGGQKAATEELIDETIQFIEAAKMGIAVSDARVDAAVDEIAARVKMTTKQLSQALGQQGVDIETLRRRIKAQMVWGQLVQMRTRMRGGSVKGSDVTAAMFAESGSEDIKTTEYTLKPIIFVVPKGSSAGYRRPAAPRGGGLPQPLRRLRRRRRAGPAAQGSRRPQHHSPNFRGAPGRTRGPRHPGDGSGQVTRPLKTDEGYTLLAVCTAKSIQSNAAARMQAEAKLIDEVNKDLGKDYMDELRKKAVIEYR